MLKTLLYYRRQASILMLVVIFHGLFLLWINHNKKVHSARPTRLLELRLISVQKTKKEDPLVAKKVSPHKTSLSITEKAVPPHIHTTIAEPSPPLPDPTPNKPIDRQIKDITKELEKTIAFEKQKEHLAKPPNQIVREYWEAQNPPYKDKWDKLAHAIEQAGVPRGIQEESYTATDGSRITKINGKCYKAPDPGREYLHQKEVRQVFCKR